MRSRHLGPSDEGQAALAAVEARSLGRVGSIVSPLPRRPGTIRAGPKEQTPKRSVAGRVIGEQRYDVRRGRAPGDRPGGLSALPEPWWIGDVGTESPLRCHGKAAKLAAELKPGDVVASGRESATQPLVYSPVDGQGRSKPHDPRTGMPVPPLKPGGPPAYPEAGSRGRGGTQEEEWWVARNGGQVAARGPTERTRLRLQTGLGSAIPYASRSAANTRWPQRGVDHKTRSVRRGDSRRRCGGTGQAVLPRRRRLDHADGGGSNGEVRLWKVELPGCRRDRAEASRGHFPREEQ